MVKIFSDNVKDGVRRPLLLTMDGYSGHFTEHTLDIAEELQILIVLLPANATHILQPLDVAVFEPFKTSLHNFCNPKEKAIEISSEAWMNSVVYKSPNLTIGFRTCVLFPVSLPNMSRRLKLFKDRGVKNLQLQADWLKVK